MMRYSQRRSVRLLVRHVARAYRRRSVARWRDVLYIDRRQAPSCEALGAAKGGRTSKSSVGTREEGGQPTQVRTELDLYRLPRQISTKRGGRDALGPGWQRRLDTPSSSRQTCAQSGFDRKPEHAPYLCRSKDLSNVRRASGGENWETHCRRTAARAARPRRRRPCLLHAHPSD